MSNLLTQILGIDNLQKRMDELQKHVDGLQKQVDGLERTVNTGLKQFGDYKNRTKKELSLMKSQVEDLLEAVDLVVSHLENKEAIARANKLKKKLKNSETRINKYINLNVS